MTLKCAWNAGPNGTKEIPVKEIWKKPLILPVITLPEIDSKRTGDSAPNAIKFASGKTKRWILFTMILAISTFVLSVKLITNRFSDRAITCTKLIVVNIATASLDRWDPATLNNSSCYQDLFWLLDFLQYLLISDECCYSRWRFLYFLYYRCLCRWEGPMIYFAEIWEWAQEVLINSI